MDDKPVCSFCTRARVLIICTIIAGILAFRPEFDFIKKYLIFGGKNSKHSLNFTDDVGLVDNKIYSTDTICENIHF